MPTGKKTIACDNADCLKYSEPVMVAARQIACDGCGIPYPFIGKRSKAKGQL